MPGDDERHRPGEDIGIYRPPPSSARLERLRRKDNDHVTDVARRTKEDPTPMAVALAPSQAGRRPRRVGGWLQMAGRLKERQQVGGFIRLATAGAVGCSIVLPLLELARIVAGWTPSPGHAAQAVVATACYLPLHVRHVWYAARGSRPAGAGWTLTAMAVVVLGALPVIGTSWLASLHPLAVSVLIVVRPPWSLLAVASLVAATIPLAVAFGDPRWAAFYAVSVTWRGAAVFVLVWLVGATRRLEQARLLLAEEALARERLRIDGELRRTLGAALEAIAASGRRASVLVAEDAATLEDELRALVERSREALAQARRTIRGYQRPSLRAELDSAAALLTAAGIQTRLQLPRGALPDTVDAAPRAALRAAVARLLRDEAARRCSIVVTRQDGRVQLELRADGTGPAMVPVVVG
jgi:signal transduction histidine kinase